MAVDLTKVNYILLKSDGSVLAQKLDYYVQQGSTGVDKIFFGSLEAVNTDIGQAICTLPNGEQNTLIGSWDTCTYKIEGVDTTVGGFLFTLTTAQTNYNGGLTMALAIYRSSVRLVNYPLYLVINETGLQSDTDTGVTVQEINSYLQQVQQMLRVDNSILVVNTMTHEVASDKTVGQIFLETSSGVFYIKNSADYPFYTEWTGFDYVKKTHSGDKVYGTDELGNQRTFDVDSDIVSGNDGVVVRRELPGGQVVVGNPTQVYHATTKKYVDDVDATKVDKQTTSGLFAYTHLGSTQSELAIATPATGNTIAKREGDGRLKVAAPSSDGDATTKKYVDDLVATMKANAFIVVDTEAYPTLADFLASTGEEGYIYLYPSSIPEEGYYQYIWEGGSWFSIGTTKIDLSDYYTKTQSDTKFVPYTGATGNVNIGNNYYQGYKLELGENGASEFTITPADSNNNLTRIVGARGIRISSTNSVVFTNTKKYSSSDLSEVANVNYVDRYVFYMSASPMQLTSDQAFDLIAGQNIAIAYVVDNLLYKRVNRILAGAPTWESVYKEKTTQDGYTTITKKIITLDNNNTLTLSTESYSFYTPEQFDSAPTTGSNKPVTSAGIKNYVDTSISDAISAVYRYKGTKTVAELNALTGMVTGDVYNVSDAGTLTDGNVQVIAGDNVAWTGSAWDKLANDIDWTAYDEKFMSAGFFEVQDYNESTGEITMVYATELYDMTYNGDTGILSIEAN